LVEVEKSPVLVVEVILQAAVSSSVLAGEVILQVVVVVSSLELEEVWISLVEEVSSLMQEVEEI
jgi:hypothetical protein